jgi:uncharacterized membrane protein YraQ (UPF0718 family)
VRIRLQGAFQYLLLAAAAVVAAVPWQAKLHYILPDQLQNGLSIFLGIIIEALPFVLLGTLVSAGMRRFLSEDRLAKLIPKSPWLAYPSAALIGLLFPVCECGNLPVARRLIRQGMPASQALTFFLAAPILNPAVIISTWAAFRFEPSVVVGRLVCGFLIAVAVGAYFHLRGDGDMLSRFSADPEDFCQHEHAGVNGIVDELLEMVAALSLGAAIAAVVQVAVPREALLALGTSPVTAILVMMVLAVVVSLCSTVDAFFALSFASTFSTASILAFLLLGPMIDFRTIALAGRTFSTRVITEMGILVMELVFFLTLILHNLRII